MKFKREPLSVTTRKKKNVKTNETSKLYVLLALPYTLITLSDSSSWEANQMRMHFFFGN